MNIDELWLLHSIPNGDKEHYVKVQRKPYHMTEGLGVRADQWEMIAIWHIKRKTKIRMLISKIKKWIKSGRRHP